MEFIKKEPLIFIISGKARSGKDTFYSFAQEKLNDKKVVRIAFGDIIKNYLVTMGLWNGLEETKPRTLMQQFGTDIIRKQINDDLYINRVKEDILVYSYYADIIVITDARLIKEVEAIKKSYPKTYSIKINRDTDILNTTEKKHITEIGLDNYDNYDFVIDNNSSLDNYKKQIIEILDKVVK